MGYKRIRESFDQEFYEFYRRDIAHQALMNGIDAIPRSIDAEFVNKFRMADSIRRTNSVQKQHNFDVLEEERQKWMTAKSRGLLPNGEKARHGSSRRHDTVSTGYDEDFCRQYFEFYGHGFRCWEYPKGSPYMNTPDEGWKCPKCGVTDGGDPNNMDDYCPRCGCITPMGQMKMDGGFRR